MEDISPAFDAPRDTRFLVFTRFNPTQGQIVNAFDMNTVTNTHFSSGRPTRVLIHGWQRFAVRFSVVVTNQIILLQQRKFRYQFIDDSRLSQKL